MSSSQRARLIEMRSSFGIFPIFYAHMALAGCNKRHEEGPGSFMSGTFITVEKMEN